MRYVRFSQYLRALLWVMIAIAGFATKATAYNCFDSNTCLCSYPRYVSGMEGWHCCYNVCGDPNRPLCGTPVPYTEYLASCYPGSFCTIRGYKASYYWGANCSCESCG